MTVTTPSKPVQNPDVPAVYGKAAMCRQNPDCAPQHFCQMNPDPELAFGFCR